MHLYIQAAVADDFFAGLTSSSSLTPPTNRLTTPTTNSTSSGLDISSLAATRQTTSYQTPPMTRPPTSQVNYQAPSLPLQPTPLVGGGGMSSVSLQPTPAAAASILTPAPAVGTSWSPAAVRGGMNSIPSLQPTAASSGVWSSSTAPLQQTMMTPAPAAGGTSWSPAVRGEGMSSFSLQPTLAPAMGGAGGGASWSSSPSLVPLQPSPAAAPSVRGGGGMNLHSSSGAAPAPSAPSLQPPLLTPVGSGGSLLAASSVGTGMGWSSSILNPVGVSSPAPYSTSASVLQPTQSSMIAVPTSQQAFPRQPALGDNPFADNTNSLL